MPRIRKARPETETRAARGLKSLPAFVCRQDGNAASDGQQEDVK